MRNVHRSATYVADFLRLGPLTGLACPRLRRRERGQLVAGTRDLILTAQVECVSAHNFHKDRRPRDMVPSWTAMRARKQTSVPSRTWMVMTLSRLPSLPQDG